MVMDCQIGPAYALQVDLVYDIIWLPEGIKTGTYYTVKQLDDVMRSMGTI